MNILEEAAEIVNGPRPQNYGHPIDNHGCTASLWSAYLNRRLGSTIALTSLDVCYMMVLLKVSRLANDPTHIDSLVDIAGYARNAEMIMNEVMDRTNETFDQNDAEE